jgi:copine 5/8/9
MSLSKLCNSDKDALLVFSVHRAATGVEINRVTLTLNKVLLGIAAHQAAAGTLLIVKKLEITKRMSFVDYLRSGWAVSLVVAIDYTASNGNPSEPSSLHFLGPNN